jgi:hypothetical protein
VRPGRRIGGHTMSIRSRSRAGRIAIAFVRPAGVRPAIAWATIGGRCPRLNIVRKCRESASPRSLFTLSVNS